MSTHTTTPLPYTVDIAIVGAGAAGLMAAIAAGRTAQSKNTPLTIAAFDGAAALGAKILVAGGGRCNVTHHRVTHNDYAGSTPNAIKKVLQRFTVKDTINFFAALGVELKREDTGKLFPTTDSARTVLDALLSAADDACAHIHHPCRIESIDLAPDDTFTLHTPDQTIRASRLILATGGQSLPKTGSDGHGYSLARTLGHSITPRLTPALAPLKVAEDHFIRDLSGIATPATLHLRSPTSKCLTSFTGPLLCTHFGISGPVALNMSRYILHAKLDDPAHTIAVNWLPDHTSESLDNALLALGKRTLHSYLHAHLPARLIDALCTETSVDPATTGSSLRKDDRRALVHTLTAMPLPVTTSRGFLFAEATAGGVPLAQLDLKTMQSRITPNLYICGELCDVDGHLGGFNFQWAWASGHTAGTAAATSLQPQPSH